MRVVKHEELFAPIDIRHYKANYISLSKNLVMVGNDCNASIYCDKN